MATRLTQLHGARAHHHTVPVLHDLHKIPSACLAAPFGRVIGERAPIVRARGAA